MTQSDKSAAHARIAEIDAMFERAKGWGSWMVMTANDREALVDRLRAAGEDIDHKHLARTMWGGPVD